MTLESFNELNSKTKQLNRKDIWIRQLMCIRGVSMQKAMTISELFPCMRLLMESLNRYGPEEVERILKSVSGRKGLGTKLVQNVIDLFWAKKY